MQSSDAVLVEVDGPDLSARPLTDSHARDLFLLLDGFDLVELALVDTSLEADEQLNLVAAEIARAAASLHSFPSADGHLFELLEEAIGAGEVRTRTVDAGGLRRGVSRAGRRVGGVEELVQRSATGLGSSERLGDDGVDLGERLNVGKVPGLLSRRRLRVEVEPGKIVGFVGRGRDARDGSDSTGE